jgi:hypothetical protein
MKGERLAYSESLIPYPAVTSSWNLEGCHYTRTCGTVSRAVSSPRFSTCWARWSPFRLHFSCVCERWLRPGLAAFAAARLHSAELHVLVLISNTQNPPAWRQGVVLFPLPRRGVPGLRRVAMCSCA